MYIYTTCMYNVHVYIYIAIYILGLQHYNFVWTSSIPFLICPSFKSPQIHRCGEARIACHTLKKVSEG